MARRSRCFDGNTPRAFFFFNQVRKFCLIVEKGKSGGGEKWRNCTKFFLLDVQKRETFKWLKVFTAVSV